MRNISSLKSTFSKISQENNVIITDLISVILFRRKHRSSFKKCVPISKTPKFIEL